MLKRFEEPLTFRQAGGKGHRLAELYENNFNVPHGAIITTEAFEEFLNRSHENAMELIEKLPPGHDRSEQTLQQIRQTLMESSIDETLWHEIEAYASERFEKGVALAVRSSGNLEDTQEDSFAGQYESILGVRSLQELKDAILRCWTSVFQIRVLSYCWERKIRPGKISLAIILQEMIPAQFSGVVFTVNPLTGKATEMVIETVSGLGEAMVQGVVTPRTYQYDWYDHQLEMVNNGEQEKLLVMDKSKGPVWLKNEAKGHLSPSQLSSLAAVCLQIQQYYGTPQDIEWAHDGTNFWILQSRPMTSINFDTPYEWTNADFKDGGIAATIPTPYMWSMYQRIFNTTMPEYLRMIHLLTDKQNIEWTASFLGYPYWNLTAVKDGAKKIPGFVERQFDEDLGIMPNYDGDGTRTGYTPVSIFNGLRILYAINRSVKRRFRANERLMARMKRFFKQFQEISLGSLTDDDLFQLSCELLEKHHFDMESGYFLTIYDNSNLATLIKEAIEKYNKKKATPINYLQLISGLRDLSHMMPVYALWDISREVRQIPEALRFFKDNDTAVLKDLYQRDALPYFHEAIHQFIKKYAYHSLHELDILIPHWGEDPAQVFDSLKSALAMKDEENPRTLNERQYRMALVEMEKIGSSSLKKKILRHREMLWEREEMRDHSTQMYYVIRKVCLEMSKRLKDRGVIEQLEDLFFLSARQANELFGGANPEKHVEILNKNKMLHGSFRNWEKPNEIRGENRPAKEIVYPERESVIKGTACSPGRIRGRINIIKDVEDLSSMIAGNILVTKYTDPAWTPVFSKIGGLITETGGVLSHGAVVSREYGIPAVLAVKDATRILRDGCEVILDGGSGKIIVLD